MDPAIPEIEQLKLRIEVLEEEKSMLEKHNADLSLQLKYALFDSEASKREKEYYKKLLDDKHKDK